MELCFCSCDLLGMWLESAQLLEWTSLLENLLSTVIREQYRVVIKNGFSPLNRSSVRTDISRSACGMYTTESNSVDTYPFQKDFLIW